MQRLIQRTAIVFLVALLFVPSACKRQPKKVEVEATAEETQALLSMVHVADPSASVQLVKGFHSIEQNAWRWTMRNFSVALRMPPGAVQKGATLQLKLVVPDPVITQHKSVTLSASIGGIPLAPETYTKAGDYTYTRDVPAQILSRDAAAVDFTLDKALAGSALDRRELGVIVSFIGLESK